MDDEFIIRKEASGFYLNDITMGKSSLPSVHIRLIKNRLNDFYSAERKAIFLDELEILVKNELRIHRDNSHGGLPAPNCTEDQDHETLLFYLRQELGELPAIAHQKKDINPQHLRSKIFVSYCHADREYLSDLQRHFKPFLDKLIIWDDSKIEPGQKWKDEIEKAISETKVGIFLVSTDFLGSDFITTKEIPPLLAAAEEEGATILNVIIRPCLFEKFPKLNIYQAMNSPSHPVSKMDGNEREELFTNIVRQTLKLLEIK